jgi:uncharacterized spore protein YtfJ
MKISEVIDSAKDTLTVRRVYGEPYESESLTLIPAAFVAGGAGGGTGHDKRGQEGEGGGFGMSGRPAGAYVIQGGRVSWRPAVDVNKVLTMLGLVLVAYLLSRPRVLRARAELRG